MFLAIDFWIWPTWLFWRQGPYEFYWRRNICFVGNKCTPSEIEDYSATCWRFKKMNRRQKLSGNLVLKIQSVACWMESNDQNYLMLIWQGFIWRFDGYIGWGIGWYDEALMTRKFKQFFIKVWKKLFIVTILFQVGWMIVELCIINMTLQKRFAVLCLQTCSTGIFLQSIIRYRCIKKSVSLKFLFNFRLYTRFAPF